MCMSWTYFNILYHHIHMPTASSDEGSRMLRKCLKIVHILSSVSEPQPPHSASCLRVPKDSGIASISVHVLLPHHWGVIIIQCSDGVLASKECLLGYYTDT